MTRLPLWFLPVYSSQPTFSECRGPGCESRCSHWTVVCTASHVPGPSTSCACLPRRAAGGMKCRVGQDTLRALRRLVLRDQGHLPRQGHSLEARTLHFQAGLWSPANGKRPGKGAVLPGKGEGFLLVCAQTGPPRADWSTSHRPSTVKALRSSRPPATSSAEHRRGAIFFRTSTKDGVWNSKSRSFSLANVHTTRPAFCCHQTDLVQSQVVESNCSSLSCTKCPAP